MADSSEHPLIRWMARKDLSQSAAASKLEVSESYLSLVLNGQRGVTLERALKWSKLTGLKPSDFIREAAQ